MEKINHALEETDNGDAKILKAFIEGLEKKEYNPVFDSWKTKNGCKACKINACSRFLFRNDMCYCAIFFTLW